MDPITIDPNVYNIHKMDDTYYIAVKKGATQADLRDIRMEDIPISGHPDGSTANASEVILRYRTGNVPIPTGCATGTSADRRGYSARIAFSAAVGGILGAGLLFGVLKLTKKL